MNKLDSKTRSLIVKALVDGVGVNATCRLTGAAKHTVLKLLREIGAACGDYHNEHVRGIAARRIQCDEIWSFVYAKEKNVPADKKGQLGFGDVWTWTALDADTKLIVSYMLGGRDSGYATEFMGDVADRLVTRVQLTTDGHRAYLDAVSDAFDIVDYAQLVKIYGTPREATNEVRYSPAECTGCRKEAKFGDPDPKHISTSYVKRQNLSMRMGMRRFTRLTNAHSKKIENHFNAIALYFMHYNYCKIHSTLRVTPAMEAGLTNHVWEIEELLDLIGE
ncbi:MAG TPA: IS1 family transposase [Tepidisphaeraceae bacterium]|nr:IS1 family transposase [Tepidisphaeraceae bacterium]